MWLAIIHAMTWPTFMYGTAWKKDATSQLVQLAVRSGFTAIDTANQLIHYQESLVGEALLALAKNGVKRESLFLQTKFTSTGGQDHRTPYDASADVTTQVRQSFESSLVHLHTDYLDSYVLHGPTTRRGLADEDWETWAAIEEHHRAGKTRFIGVSNVSAEQLALLCSKAKIKPMVVQNRCYAVRAWDRDVREICRREKMVYQGFSLLTANGEIFADPKFRAIAERAGVGLAPVVFRFAQQIGMLPLTGTTDEQHMKEDLACGQFTLSADELKTIETIAL